MIRKNGLRKDNNFETKLKKTSIKENGLWPMERNFKIFSEISNLRVIEKAIDEISAELDINPENYGKIMVCTMEAVNNAIIHGNKADISKIVQVNILPEREELKISIEDQGPGFRPDKVPDPTKVENIEKLTGRGIYLMSHLADGIEFNEKGNRVTMTFKYLAV